MSTDRGLLAAYTVIDCLMEHQWGPWREHDGTGCPVVGQIVHIVMEEPAEGSPGEEWGPETLEVINDYECIDLAAPVGSWTWEPGHWPIVRYRVRKPLGLTILEGILQLASNGPSKTAKQPGVLSEEEAQAPKEFAERAQAESPKETTRCRIVARTTPEGA